MMPYALRLITMMSIAGLIAAAAHAHAGYGGRWWHAPETAATLNLTESEVDRLDTVFETARIRMIELKGDVEVEQRKLRVLMEQPELDETAVRDQHRRQEAARTELAGVRFEFLLEVRKIIGHDRFQELLDMREERKQQRRLERQEKDGRQSE